MVQDKVILRAEDVATWFPVRGALGRVVRHPALQGLPFVLETPNELPGYAQEIALLRRRYREA